MINHTENYKKLKHLYWRTGCGPDLDILNNPVTIENAVEQIFEDSKIFIPLTFGSAEDGDSLMANEMTSHKKSAICNVNGEAKIAETSAQWFNNFVWGKSFFREKMAYFWINHFACRMGSAGVARDYSNIIRKNALGKFGDLVHAVSKSTGMLRFLNNSLNTKKYPNENFARELMELFTLGRGNYTEQDVREASRSFTGWTYKRDTLEFRLSLKDHDFGDKTFLGQTANHNGWDIINIILEQKQCARFIVSKIYSHFVSETASPQIIESLADYFYKNEYDIEKLMRKIFTSEWFYGTTVVGVKIKTPVDLLGGLMKFYNMHFIDPKAYLVAQRTMGFDLFLPLSVAGWNFSKGYIDSSALLMRINASKWLFESRLLNSMEASVLMDEEMNEDESIKDDDLKLVKCSYDLNKANKYFANEDLKLQAVDLVNFLIQPEKKYFNANDIINGSKNNSVLAFSQKITAVPEYQFC